VTWNETNHVKWKVKLPGAGSGSPIVWENQIFLHSAIPAGRKPEPQPGGKEGAALPRPQVAGLPQTPAAPPPDGEPGRRRRGPPGGGSGGRSEQPTDVHQFTLLCLDRSTGKLLWQKAAREEVPHEGHHPTGSFASSSPVTDGQHVLAFFGSHGLHCFDMNGTLKWKKDLGRMRIKNSFGEGVPTRSTPTPWW